MPHRSRCTFLAVAAMWAICFAFDARASTWTADADVSFERTTEVKADGNSHEDSLEQSYSLGFDTFLLPTLEFTLEFTLDLDQTDTEEADGTRLRERETSPSVEMNLVSTWWDFFASWEETRNTSSDSDVGATSEVEWEFEWVVEPEYELLPAFSFNYSDGNDEVEETDLEIALEYSFLEMLDITLGYSLETTDDPEPDSDERGWTIETEVSLAHDLAESLSIEADWETERDHVVQLDDSGKVLQRDDTFSNDVRAMLSWNVLELVELSLEKEVEWDKDLEQDKLEVTDTWTGEAEYDADLTDTIHLNLSYADERENSRPIGAHTYTITQDYTAELEFSPFPFLSLTPSFDRSDTREWTRDSGGETENTVEDTYEVALDYTLWEDFAEVSLTRTWDLTHEHGVSTTEERSWEVEMTFSLFKVPNLEITPDYNYTRDDDFIAGTTDTEETIEVNINYLISLHDTVVFEIDHTYERTQEWPAEATMNIERTDDSELTLTWKEFLIGHNLELTLTREASDTSGDDKRPEIDYTYSITYDWDILSNYAISFEYNHDKKSADVDTRDFTTTVTAELYNGLVTIDFEHEFEEELEGDREQTHRYLIEIQGQF